MKAFVYTRCVSPEVFQLVFGVTRPRQLIPGTELPGVVTAVGKNVSRFQSGDAAMGCYAAYVWMPRDGDIAIKPTGLSFEQAACLSFGGSTALYFLRKAKLQSGESVLIHGADRVIDLFDSPRGCIE